MSEKTFRILLVMITVLGCISTVAMVIYTYYLYTHCSITSFIAGGR